MNAVRSRALVRNLTSFRAAASANTAVSFRLDDSVQKGTRRPSTPADRAQQLTRHFTSTSATKMSQSHFQISNLYDVKGKIALVTGGGSGIGLMATQALAVNGAKVYICGRTSEKLDTVVENFGKDIAGQIIPISADITSKSEIKKLVSELSSKEKHLDILVNNAGVALNSQGTTADSGAELSKNLFDDENETFDMWTDTYRTNVASIFFLSTAFLPLLEASSKNNPAYSSVIINITSISGIVKTSQHHFAYNASKGAAIHVNNMLANTFAAENRLKIRVNSIAPGVFPSEMTAKDSDEKQKSHIEKEKYDKVPARRPGKEEDMAQAVLFVATNQYLNGVTIPVDGGYILMAGSV